jgi:hypothetical protein
MPIIRSSKVLYGGCCLWVFVAVVFKLLVWCGAEGYVSGLQDAAASCILLQEMCMLLVKVQEILPVNIINVQTAAVEKQSVSVLCGMFSVAWYIFDKHSSLKFGCTPLWQS